MKLYFVRHGESVDLAPTDHARELTEYGIERTQNAAKVLKRIGINPKCIYSSPRIRAKQTADIIAEELGMEVTLSESVNFGFDVTHIRELVKDFNSGDEVMFVGHNPDMSQLVHKISGASVSMKKGGFARIDVISAKNLRGELVWLVSPKVFDALVNQPESSDLHALLEDTSPLFVIEDDEDDTSPNSPTSSSQ